MGIYRMKNNEEKEKNDGRLVCRVAKGSLSLEAQVILLRGLPCRCTAPCLAFLSGFYYVSVTPSRKTRWASIPSSRT